MMTKTVLGDVPDTDLVRDAPPRASDNAGGPRALNAGGPRTLHLFDLSEEFDIVYEKPPDEQTVSMEYDDPDSGVGLDRMDYPRNTGVVITIDDQALNVDPTSEDSWTFATGGGQFYMDGSLDGLADDAEARDAAIFDARKIMVDAIKAAKLKPATYESIAGRGDRTSNDPASDDYKGSALVLFQRTAGDGDRSVTVLNQDESVPANYRGSAWIEYDKAAARIAVNIDEPAVSGLEPFDIDAGTILECRTCTALGGTIWMKFTEDGDNDSKFNNAPGDRPSIRTAADAPRGRLFSVEYDNTLTAGIVHTSSLIVHAEGEWNSGKEIAVTLTDSDANTNSLAQDNLDVSNPGHTIPTITVGDPLTLTNGITASLGGDVTGVLGGVGDQGVSQRQGITTNGVPVDGTLIITISGDFAGADGVYQVVNYDLGAFEGASLAIGRDAAALSGTFVVDAGNPIPTTFTLAFEAGDSLPAESAIAIDVFTFGLEGGQGDNVNNAIYRLELEEDGNDSSDFRGTLEYIGLNQINILEQSTYEGIDASGDSIILISDDDSVSVEYLDLDFTGGTTKFTVRADTPTRSGLVSFDSGNYRVADTITITVEDADLNVDSGKADIYTTYGGMISSRNAVMELLTVSIGGDAWAAGCGGMTGLGATGFTLRETGKDSGVFAGTFAAPAEYCTPGGKAAPTTGTSISAEYVDFRDDSGSTTAISASAGIRAVTGSVSLDRAVYPVPFGEDSFGTHGGFLAGGALTAYIRIADADFDLKSDGIDSIRVDGAAPLTVSVIRGSDIHPIAYAGNATDAIAETAPASGVFEHEIRIPYGIGPESGKCPAGTKGCILQGDVLHAQYADPHDASGSKNTVTNSATFDLRSGVLQSDKAAYVIGSDMILTLIEPDLNLDGDATETYTLDLIEWDSDAGTEPLSDSVFSATPSNLLETGTDTGIFQVVITVPDEIDEESLQRGEEITLTYNDWGPSGSDYVGDKDEEITATAYTSDFGASIELDQKVYTWTDKVYITIVAPDHNFDADQVDEIGADDTDYPINIKTQEADIEGYKLVETGADTGIFSGELILTGVDNDDYPELGTTDGFGPTDGKLAAEDSDGLAVVFENSDGDIVRASAIIQWNVGEVEWLEASYPALGSGIVRVIDPDLNLNPEAVDNFDVNVWSDSDVGGISLTVTETNAATGIFEGTVFFDDDSISSGHRLNVEEGDTVVAEYDDLTSPIEDETSVSATTLIGTIVPPLERAPINNLRAVDTFDSSIGSPSVGQQVVITADLSNGQDRDQDFIFLIQVQDENGVTVSLNWVLGTLAADQSFSPGASWTPTEAGTYDVTAFVWESIDNPTALSPTATIALTVN